MSDNLNLKQKEAYERIIRGDNLCIMGKGGSGKSYICELIKNKKTLFVSPTGMAALNIGPHARTIHSTLMLGSKSLKAWSWENVSSEIENNKTKLLDFFDRYERIVFDESSMIISGLFNTYIKMFHFIYETSSETLFNNKQIIMILDPLQLPPVKNTSEPYLDMNNRNINRLNKKLSKSDLIIENPEFKSLFNGDNIIHLNKNMRCLDEEWDEVLQGCRLGFNGYSEGEKRILLSRLNERVFSYNLDIKPDTELLEKFNNSLKTTLSRDKIMELNIDKYNKLIDNGNINSIIRRELTITDQQFYSNHIEYFPNKNISDKTLYHAVNYMDDLSGYYAERIEQDGIKSFDYDFNIVEGGRIMYRKNDEIIRNGSLGTINKININDLDEVETIDIKFDKIPEIIKIEKEIFEHPDFNDIKISAFPIIPAFAITIHKLQAQTCDFPLSILYDTHMIPYHEKKDHLLYTAISRCKKKEDVFIISRCEIDESYFPINKYMYDWYIDNSN